MAINAEGPESGTAVIDSNKIKCGYCGGVKLMVSELGDEPEDLLSDAAFIALGLTNATERTCSQALCVQCGKLTTIQIQLFDTWTFTGAETTPIGTDLDSSVVNSLAGWWFVCGVGTDIWKYVAISSNTAAAPTAITLAFAIADDGDGVSYVTNVEPVGLTKIVA